jgi:hypothetical protein
MQLCPLHGPGGIENQGTCGTAGAFAGVGKAERSAVRIDGNSCSLGYQGRYAQVGKVVRGETVAVSFPISERTERRSIEGSDCTFVLWRNDVVAVDPVGTYLPFYQRCHYRIGPPLYRKVQRFVSAQEFAWW